MIKATDKTKTIKIMTKQDLALEISRETGVSSREVSLVLESFMCNVKKVISGKGEVTLRNFGTFTMKHMGEKKARNVHSNTQIVIPARDVPSFKPSKRFFEDM